MSFLARQVNDPFFKQSLDFVNVYKKPPEIRGTLVAIPYLCRACLLGGMMPEKTSRRRKFDGE